MLRHEIILKIKKTPSDADVDARLTQARAKAARIPGVLSASVGRTADKDYRVAILAITVADPAALFRLKIHHLHATVVGLLQDIAEDIALSDGPSAPVISDYGNL